MMTHLRHAPYFRVLNCTKSCPLSLPARLVYGLLAFRDRIGQTANLTYVREYLRIDRTARPALDELATRGLVSVKNDQYRAVEPGPDQRSWFAPKSRPGKHWSDRFYTFRYFQAVPACPLTVQQLAVYYLCLCLDLERQEASTGRDRWFSIAGTATILSVSESTVKRAVDALETHGLCRFTRTPKGYDVEMRGSEHDWWARRPDAKPGPVWLRCARKYERSDKKVSRRSGPSTSCGRSTRVPTRTACAPTPVSGCCLSTTCWRR
jgi:biotin operon repressor